MDKRQRKRLRTMLAGLDTGERNRLTKRAAGMRKAVARRSTPGAPRRPLEEFLWELLGSGEGEPGGGERSSRVDVAAHAHGVVVAESPGACRVALEDGRLEDTSLPEDLARRQRSAVAVGDEVLLERRGDRHRVIAVLPRRSLLTRADPLVPGRRHAIAANIDLVVVVVALDAPPLHPRLIDRYLVAVEQSGARPVLVVNKVDLADHERRGSALARLHPYRSLGVTVLPCSVALGEGVDAVRAVLAHRTCVFVGQSGVGKSSLLNALAGVAAATTAAVRAGDGRGHHTTTASTMHVVGDGTRVIDTPGIRRFGLGETDPAVIAAGFAEFRPYVGRCRYRDCTHATEPGCEVRRAVAAGNVSQDRYRSYRKLIAGDAG